MSMLEKYSAALKNKDEATMNDLLHDDFKFTMHKSGNVLTKGDVIKWAMSGDINQDKARIVYENDEVGIHHAFVTFRCIRGFFKCTVVVKYFMNHQIRHHSAI